MDKEKNIQIDILDQENEYKAWLEYSKIDYDCAVCLNEAPMHPRPMNIICYHCQQAAEKAAKALVVYYGSPGGMAKNHSVEFQFNQIKNILKQDKGIDVPEEIIIKSAEISMYASEPRYPNELVVEEQDVNKVLQDSKIIMDWVTKVIESPRIVEEST
mgnify:CR=1 FL=1